MTQFNNGSILQTKLLKAIEKSQSKPLPYSSMQEVVQPSSLSSLSDAYFTQVIKEVKQKVVNDAEFKQIQDRFPFTKQLLEKDNK